MHRRHRQNASRLILLSASLAGWACSGSRVAPAEDAAIGGMATIVGTGGSTVGTGRSTAGTGGANASGGATSIAVPANAGSYKLIVVDSQGKKLGESVALLRVQ